MAAAVFHDYDQEALDREFNNRAKVENLNHKTLQSDGSESAKAQFSLQVDVAYGPGPAEVVDIYLPDGDGPHPIHLFFHGGYWVSNTKDDFGFVALPFVPHGAIVVVVEYGLIPTVTMSELIDQCRASVAWTWRNAGTFGGDPNNITMSGHSAGGQIVAMMMATDWPAFDSDVPDDVIRGGCGISGVYDLEPVRLSYLNDDLGLSPEAARANSPPLLEPRVRAPLLLPVGGDEGPEYIRQSEEMASAWAASGLDAQAWIMPGHNHFATINQFLDPDSDLSRAVRLQMGID
jgi:arylformamidase